jgi:hypothetical protein
MPKLDRTLTASFFVVLAPAFLAGACATATTPAISDTGNGGTTGDGGTKGDGGTTSSGGSAASPGSGGTSTGGIPTVTNGGTTSTGGVIGATGGVIGATGGRATGGTTSLTGGATSLTGGVPGATGGSVTATGGTAVVTTGGAPAATGGTVTATGGVATGTGGGPANSVTLLAGGFYQMSTTLAGYCFTAHDSVTTITPPCGTAGPCFTPGTGLCVSGVIAQDTTAYANWGMAVGCNLSQSQTIANDTAHPVTLPATASIQVTLSANASTALPTTLRVQVIGSDTAATAYCATLTLTGGTGTVALSSLKSLCWGTTGVAFNPATMQVVNVQVEAISNQTSTIPYNFCVKALTIS